VKRNRV